MKDKVRKINIGSLFLIPVLLCTLLLISTPETFSQEIHPKLMLPVGHTHWINSAEFSPNGELVVTASWDSSARIWDANSGTLIQVLKGHKNVVTSAQFSPDGKLVVTASWDGTARIWDVKRGSLLKILEGHLLHILSFQFSPDGQTLATASIDKTIRIWDIKSGTPLHVFKGHTDGVNSVQFNLTGERIVTTSWDGTARTWNVKTAEQLQVFEGYTDGVKLVQFSPDGKSMVTASLNGAVHLWDVETGVELQVFEGHIGGVNSVQFSPDGKLIVTASKDSTIRIWDVKSAEQLQVFEGHTVGVNSVQFSPDGRLIVTASRDSTIRIWDVKSAEQLQVFEGHTVGVNSVQFSPDGRLILTTSGDITPRIWDVKTGTLIHPLKGYTNWINSAHFNRDGQKVLIASGDEAVRVWDVNEGTILNLLDNHESKINFAKFSPDGLNIVTTSWDSKAYIWDLKSGGLLHELEGHKEWINSAHFSPEGKLLVTASDDNTARIWDVNSGVLLQILEVYTDSITTAQFSPDGEKLVTASWDSNVRIWDVKGGELLHLLEGHIYGVSSAQFSPDGKLILTGSRDGTARIWDVNSGKMLQLLDGHKFGLETAQFSPDGLQVVTACRYGTTNIWDIESGELVDEHLFKGLFLSLSFTNNLLITHDNSLLHLYDLNTGNLLYSFVAVGQDDWLVIDEHHRFDGSPGARDMLYFVCGLEVTTLNQLKDALYVPGLATKILNGEDINFPKLEELEICGVFPDIQLKKETEDYFKYLIKPGKKEVETLEIWLNNRLFRSLPFSSVVKTDDVYVLSISRPEIEAFFVKGEDNTISVNGLIRLMDTEARSRGMAVVNREYREKQADPRLFSLMIGVNDYRDDRLNLRFPAKDAMDLGEAIELAAGKLLGVDNVFTYYVHSKVNQTGGFTTPEKEGIRRALEEIGQQSRPEDVLLIFFAGHGTVRDSDGQFVLLTADASELLPTGITTAELQEWISPDGPHQMKANKAILIFDACNSGRGAEEMIAWARSDKETRRRRQIDDLSDKAGMYILAASAASQNAYEVRHYEQGLLSYSLLHTLQNNPGILDDNSFLNVQKWFLDSESYLQNMVRELGLQQQAQPYGTANIRIGIVDDEVRSAIRLAEIRPVVYCAVAINSTLALDNLEIKDRLNNALQEISDRGSAASVIYSYQGSTQAYRINIIYELEGNTIKCRISLLRANELVHQMEISGSVVYMKDLIEQILDGVLGVVGE